MVLFKKGYDGDPLRCLGPEEAKEMINFIKEKIIVRFGVPHRIISDNDTPFVNSDVKRMLESYQVKHHR